MISTAENRALIQEYERKKEKKCNRICQFVDSSTSWFKNIFQFKIIHIPELEPRIVGQKQYDFYCREMLYIYPRGKIESGRLVESWNKARRKSDPRLSSRAEFSVVSSDLRLILSSNLRSNLKSNSRYNLGSKLRSNLRSMKRLTRTSKTMKRSTRTPKLWRGGPWHRRLWVGVKILGDEM